VKDIEWPSRCATDLRGDDGRIDQPTRCISIDIHAEKRLRVLDKRRRRKLELFLSPRGADVSCVTPKKKQYLR
jgi:hypothetical protein